MRSVAIYGAGGLGREILSLVHALKDEWTAVGFYDDGIVRGTRIDGMEVQGGIGDMLALKDTPVVIAIGDPAIKEKIVARLQQRVPFATLIHPAAVLQHSHSISIGEGTVITAGCILTTGISLGSHVLINLNVTIGHDVMIGDCTSVMPGVNLAGRVRVGRSVLIGSGAQVINQASLGDHARVGAGAVVLGDVEANQTVVGVPAKGVSKG